jgi:hypothetical protein
MPTLFIIRFSAWAFFLFLAVGFVLQATSHTMKHVSTAITD